MREQVVLIGAGSVSFMRGLTADLIASGMEADLALVDIDADALGVAEAIARKMVQASGASITVRASTDRREVLPGATAVICTIGVGGRRAWEQDVFIPRKYGIWQPVGDSVLPGGSSRALRMIPAMVAIARDVLELCPDALLFNYGNPMAPVCRAVRQATGANIVGLCHGVFGVADYLAKQLGVTVDRLNYSAVGMNHLTWFTEVRVDGQDAMGRLLEIADEKLAEADAALPPDRMHAVTPFSWWLLKTFGGFPSACDRHVVEFFPHLFARPESYWGTTLGQQAYSFENCIAGGDRGHEQMRRVALSDEPLPPEWFRHSGGEHEQVIEIIASIRADAGRIYSANLPNAGQVPNLPAEAILESPAVADGAGLRPILQPPLSAALAGTLATRLAWVETIVQAALEGSRQKFVQALILDGAVGSLAVAEQLADDLLAAQAPYLPQFA